MNRFTHFLACAAALAFASAANAGNQSGGKAITLIPTNNGAYSFVSNGTRVGTPPCASGAPNNWAIDLSTPSGQALAASVITAFSSGKTMDIVGTNTCLAAQPDVEQVSYISIFQ
jgi:hypothetical protein